VALLSVSSTDHTICFTLIHPAEVLIQPGVFVFLFCNCWSATAAGWAAIADDVALLLLAGLLLLLAGQLLPQVLSYCC
jgi:hypothetical protein